MTLYKYNCIHIVFNVLGCHSDASSNMYIWACLVVLYYLGFPYLLTLLLFNKAVSLLYYV